MRFTPAAVAMTAALTLTLSACGSSDDSESAATTSAATASAESTAGPRECATEPAADDAPADWELAGETGSVAVVGSTDATAPRVDVVTPFSVAETTVHTLRAGDGEAVPEDATVTVCYEGVNGRTGEIFDSSFTGGTPVEFPLNGVINGFKVAIAGQTVGSTVAVAMTSADGYPNGMAAAGIEIGDTLVFALEILEANTAGS